METEDQLVNYSHCLICSSSVITPDIKEEPDLDQEDDDCQSVIIFLLAKLLEIPQDQVVQLQEKFINQQLNTFYCESCTTLTSSAKQIYTEILEVTRKFRKVQKQIVKQISRSGDLRRDTTLSTSNRDGLLDFCRNFLNKHDFNGFGYPFVVDFDGIPLKNSLVFSSLPRKSSECQSDDDDPLVDKIKEEPISENEDEDNGFGGIGKDDEDYLQNSAASSADEDTQSESDSDFEPPEPPKSRTKKAPPPPNSSSGNIVKDDKIEDSSSADGDSQSESNSDSEPPSPPPPKKAAKKPPPKKPSSSPSPRRLKRGPAKVHTRKARIEAALASNPHAKNKHGFLKKLSKFERLHPNYPKLTQDPTTKSFHCSEPSCSKIYPRKASLERHIIIEHLQDNFYKCEEPNCGTSYATKEHFKDHVSWHAGVPRWKCEEKVTTLDGGTMQCPEAFFVRKKLNRHVQQVHQVDNPIICELCGKRLSCQEYLSSHKFNYHSKNMPDGDEEPRRKKEPTNHFCNYCGKFFKFKGDLKTHINKVHEKTEGKFACHFCEYKCSKKIWLKQHLWRKHDKFSLEGYEPPIPKEARSPSKLGRPSDDEPEDKLTAEGWRRRRGAYQCEVKGCKIVFRREDNFKKHMEEKHRGGEEGPSYFQFICKFCGKGFHLKFKKELHEEAHENKESKPFSCEICGKRFAILHYLKIHNSNMHKSGG